MSEKNVFAFRFINEIMHIIHARKLFLLVVRMDGLDLKNMGLRLRVYQYQCISHFLGDILAHAAAQTGYLFHIDTFLEKNDTIGKKIQSNLGHGCFGVLFFFVLRILYIKAVV